MRISYWDLKGHTFTAQGAAQRRYQVLAVKRKTCQLLRQDGEIVELPTNDVLRIVNSR